MDVLTRDALDELVAVHEPACVSIFLPTHRVGPDSRRFAAEDVIRWKNLLRTAEDRLRAAGLSDRDAEARLAPGRALRDDVDFWQYQSDGLAAFATPTLFRTYRVPVSFHELVVVAPRFHVKPLLALLGDDRFHILALSQNEVRLIAAGRDSAGEIDIASAPRSLQEALRFDDPERQLQYHTATPAPGGRPGAVFHGHGVGSDDQDTNVLRFCQQVDRGLADVFRGLSAPLVLAAVESVAATYRQANTYAHLIDPTVAGNPEGLSARELQGRAWPLVEPYLLGARQAIVARYLERRGTRRASSELRDVLQAAADGRVEALLVPVGLQRWGRVEDGGRRAVVHDAPEPGDEDLLNAVAIQTLATGGAVHALAPAAMPDGALVAATLRY